MVMDGKHRVALTRECTTGIVCWEELRWPDDDYGMEELEQQLGAFMLSSLVKFTKASSDDDHLCVHFAVRLMDDEEFRSLEDDTTRTGLTELIHAVERGEGG